MVIPGGFAVRPESLLRFAFFPQGTLLVIKTFNIMPFFTFRVYNMGYPVKYPRIFPIPMFARFANVFYPCHFGSYLDSNKSFAQT